MSSTTYVRYELLRMLRNRRFFLFSLGFPLVLYFLIAGPNRHEDEPRRKRHLRAALLHGRARRVRDDELGHLGRCTNRARPQRRLDAAAAADAALAAQLPRDEDPRPAYLTALITIACSAVAGTTLGVRLSATSWAETIALLLVGLLPFAALGILFGHLLDVDSLGPAVGGTTALLRIPRRRLVPDR